MHSTSAPQARPCADKFPAPLCNDDDTYDEHTSRDKLTQQREDMSTSNAVEGKGDAGVKLDSTSAVPPPSPMESNHRERLVQRLRRISLRSSASRGSPTKGKGEAPVAEAAIRHAHKQADAAQLAKAAPQEAKAPAPPSKDTEPDQKSAQTTSLATVPQPMLKSEEPDEPQPVDLGAQIVSSG